MRLITPEDPGFRRPRHDPEHPTEASFARYCAWRATKCEPRDALDKTQRFHEQNQSIHEFIGEVAELGELIMDNDLDVIDKAPRVKLINEIGDIFFCGCWVLDAFGVNVLRVEDIRTADMVRPEQQARCDAMSRRFRDGLACDEAEVDEIRSHVATFACNMLVYSGLLSNSFKKEVYQQRPQSRDEVRDRVLSVLALASGLLYVAGSSPIEALRVNISKLDHRYPEGYRGPGGGDRTGKGAGSEPS